MEDQLQFSCKYLSICKIIIIIIISKNSHDYINVFIPNGKVF